MFIDVFNARCESIGLAPTKVLDDIGMNRSSYTGWKNGSEPSNPTKKKIADYFGITVKQLLSGETEKAPAEKAEAHDEMNEILQDFRDNPELRALFSLSRKATPEQLKQYANVIKALRGSNDGECDY